jgi:hypothetical protein
MLFLPGHPTFSASPAPATGKEKNFFKTRLVHFFFSSWSDSEYASGVEAYVSRKCETEKGEGKKAEANKPPQARAGKITSKLNAEANRSVRVKEKNGLWTRVVGRDGGLQLCVEEYRSVSLFCFLLGCGSDLGVGGFGWFERC